MKSEYSKKQIDEAIRWVLRHEEEMTEEQLRAFSRWKKEHPNNEKCFFEHQVGWVSFDSMRFWKPDMSHDPNPDLFASGSGEHRHQRYWVTALSLAACLLVGFGFFFQVQRSKTDIPMSLQSPSVAVETYEGGKKHFLSDGSSFYLKEGSVLEVSFTEQLRSLYLKSGEAIFDVAHDANRPFVVSTDRTEVVAIGTAFSVNSNPSFCEVYVTEGKVKLNETRELPSGTRESTNLIPELKAGQMVNVPVSQGAFQPPTVQAFSNEEFAAKTYWKLEIIEMVSAPLYEIIQEFNKYNAVDIYIPDPELRNIRMSVSVNPDNQQEFLQLLEMTMHVEIKETASAVYIQVKSQQ